MRFECVVWPAINYAIARAFECGWAIVTDDDRLLETNFMIRLGTVERMRERAKEKERKTERDELK